LSKQICGIYIDPPIAIARLGGSLTPLEAYRWVDSPDPRAAGQTAIEADWSLRVRPDATLEPYRPAELLFRDDGLIRPVCPFFELHVLLGDPKADPSTWVSAPLTHELLAQRGLSLAHVSLTVDAQNHKAYRRTGNPDHRFGTFPPVELTADDTRPRALAATSPPDAAKPIIPRGRPIPLGYVRFLRSSPQPPLGSTEWAGTAASAGPPAVDYQPPRVRLDVLRIRFTPAAGLMYGPPQAAHPLKVPNYPNRIAPVDTSRAFLDPTARWWHHHVRSDSVVQPWDTYDGADVGGNFAYGVVDDTCEAAIKAELRVGRRRLRARANVFVGPPDFGPDRRPFLSLADELNDRAGDNAARTARMTAQDRDAWVQDLFSRIFETLSLMNIDVWRQERAAELADSQLLRTRIEGDGVARDRHALGGRDALRDPLRTIPESNPTDPLPITTHARDRHRALLDLDELRDTVVEHPGRLRQLIRGPFELEPVETADYSTMRMPPFMRDSNAFPLTLAAWQYDLLMSWVSDAEAGRDGPPAAAADSFAGRAELKRRAVLARARSTAGGSQ
jgi:hypothetical protein